MLSHRAPARSEGHAPSAAPEASERPNVAGGLIGFYAFVFLGVVIPLQVLNFDGLYELSTPAAGSILLVLIAAGRLSILVAAGTPYLLTFMFWVYVYVWLGLASLAQITGNHFPIGSALPYDTGAQFATIVIALGGALAFEVGRRFRLTDAGVVARALERTVDPGRVRILALLAVPVSAAIALSVGGLDTLLSPREVATARIMGAPPTGANFHLIQDKTSGVLKIVLLTIPLFLALYLFLYLRRQRRMGRAGLLAVLVVANLVVNNPIANPRLWFGMVVLCTGVALVPVDRPSRFRIGAVGLIGLILVVFPYADAFRQSTRLQIQARPLGEQLRTNPDYDSFQVILTTKKYVEDQGHTRGRQALGAAFFWMPRSFWDGKPRDTSQVVAEHAGFTYTNVSCPLWAEAFADGGLLWVLVLFAGYGRLVATLDTAYVRRRKGRTVVSALVPVLAAYELILLRGALLPAMARLAALVGIIVFTSRREPLAQDA